MGAGANAGGFAAGFGKGLSNALMRNRDRSDTIAKEDRARKDKLFNEYVLPSAFKYLEENPDADSAALENLLTHQYPEQFGKSSSKKGGSPFDTMRRFLGPLIGMRPKQPMANDLPEQGGIDGTLRRTGVGPIPLGGRRSIESGGFTGDQPLSSGTLPPSAQPPGVTGGTLDALQGTQQPGQVYQPTAADISSADAARIIGTPGGGSTATSPTAGVQAPAGPARRTLMGVPVMSAEERALAMVKRAQTILPALRAADPTATLEDAFSILRTGTMTRDQRTAGTSAASLFDEQLKRRATEKGRPLTADEVAQERQKWEALNDSPSSRSLGIYAERAARDLGFASAEAAAVAGKMPEVNKRANELAAGQAGATTTARGAAQGAAPLTTSQKFQAITDLQTAWRKAEGPAREMERQFKLMETGLDRFRKGDKIGGSQAVLVTFQKILDPQSVVRESEYARSPQGLALGSRLEGFMERLKEGGAGVPDAELAMMVDTARAFLDGMQGWNDLERERIGSTAKDFGLDPARVFGVAAAATKKDAGGGGAGTTGTAPPVAGAPYKDDKGNWVIP